MVAFVKKLLSENDFEAVFANFWCYDYGSNTSEAIQKNTTRTLELYATRTLELYANSLKQVIL